LPSQTRCTYPYLLESFQRQLPTRLRISADAVPSTRWETVFVQYIRSPGYFVVQHESDMDKIEELSVEINSAVNEQQPSSAVADQELQPGTF